MEIVSLLAVFSSTIDIILSILNPVMYGSFILGFVWSKEKYNYL